MSHATLSELIESLEWGTKLHICIAFLDRCGNRKTLLPSGQSIHDRPVCLAVKNQPHGLASCYRCRNAVYKAVIRRRKSMAGLCTNGVYEYCRPVIYEEKPVCVIFVGNILTQDPAQREKLAARVGSELLETMEQCCTPEDCVRIADVLESYIMLLFDRYGMENKTFEPLVENIKNYIRENLSYDLSVEEIAAAFNYTPKYLGSLFKSRTGQSVKEYCNALRLNRAKEMLRDTGVSIASIAMQTGFNSTTYFDRVFRKSTGLSPQAYRRTGKKAPDR